MQVRGQVRERSASLPADVDKHESSVAARTEQWRECRGAS